MEKKKDTVAEELAQAGEASPITPQLQELDGYRITTDRRLKQEDFLFRLKGTPCFPRRDITAITGQAKSGKTIFVSMLMACCSQRQVLGLERISEEPLKVMWIDTEQSPHRQKRPGLLRPHRGHAATALKEPPLSTYPSPLLKEGGYGRRGCSGRAYAATTDDET